MSSFTQGVDVHPSMLNQSWNTPLVCYCAAAFHASFNLLYFCFLKCAISFCCCGAFSFDLCFCVHVLHFLLWWRLFFCFNDFLVSFFEFGHFNTDVFSAWSRSSYSIVSCFFVFLKCHGDHESSHDTSVVTSHVDHVVGLGIFSVSQISSLGQKIVNLFFLEKRMSFVSEVSS